LGRYGESLRNFHGQVGWMHRPVGGEESRPCNHIYITRKLRPVGGELHYFDLVVIPMKEVLRHLNLDGRIVR
jgi:hypothetical protein